MRWGRPTAYPLSVNATILRGDDKGRYQLRSLLPKRTPAVSAETREDGTILLTPLAAPPTAAKPRLIRRKGKMWLITGLGPITEEQVKAIVEEEV